MKKVLVSAFAIGLSLLSTAAFAGSPYVSGYLGGVTRPDADFTDTGVNGSFSFDNNIIYGIEGGYDFKTGGPVSYRLGLELSYFKTDFDKVEIIGLSLPADGDLSRLTLMGNAYFDFNCLGTKTFTPYAVVGIGVAKNSVSAGSFDDDSTDFAYKLGVGASWKVAEQMSIDGQLSWLPTAESSFGTTDVDQNAFAATVGLRYTF